MRAMGLNTLCTYAFWNVHEPEPGRFDFSGNHDIAAYIRTAAEEGLHVLLRPGPYVCAEWDFGGFPYWLLAPPGMKVRTADPRFLSAAARYMKRLGEQVAPLQITRGGPIIMVQVENEYGSFGSDKAYLQAIRQMIRHAGFDVTLYTADGSDREQLSAGTLPDVLAAINFGAGDPAPEFASFEKFRQGVPKMCGEYWVGWFDHWGETHHTLPASRVLKGYQWMISRGISVNIYMIHGGTSFAFMNGANYGRAYEPDTSSYDYDSPLDEAGRPTPKFYALRDTIRKYCPAAANLPDLPLPTKAIKIAHFELTQYAPLTSLMQKPVRSARPKTMAEIGQAYGYVLYRTQPPRASRGILEITGLHDFAVLRQGARLLGTLDRRLKQTKLDISVDASQPIDILVENMGRINFGPQLLDDPKGITQQVTFNGQELKDWETYSLPMTDLLRLQFSNKIADGPGFYRGEFTLTEAGDTFLDLQAFGKGCVWVNGRNLGRYWNIGPQHSAYVPGPWLKKGPNEVIVFDLFSGGSRTIQGTYNALYQNQK